MMANPETAPKIDWAYYRGRIPVQGMVDDFRKKYESLNIPYPIDNVTPQIDQQENQTVSSCTFGSAVEISDVIYY
jgi:F-type H+-transporting ATPase subunit d